MVVAFIMSNSSASTSRGHLTPDQISQAKKALDVLCSLTEKVVPASAAIVPGPSQPPAVTVPPRSQKSRTDDGSLLTLTVSHQTDPLSVRKLKVMMIAY